MIDGFERSEMEMEETGNRVRRSDDDMDASSNHNDVTSSENLRRIQIQTTSGRRVLNTVTPCAACKLLRRRCAEECPFSPYFSPHEPHKFAVVHKVFGASNVSKMLMEVAESERADAANSLVYEANVRLRDPVYGCMGAISALQTHLHTLQAELSAVRSDILTFKYREAAAAASGSPLHHLSLAALQAAAAGRDGSMSTTTTATQPQRPRTPPNASLYASPSGGGGGFSSISSESVAYFDSRHI